MLPTRVWIALAAGALFYNAAQAQNTPAPAPLPPKMMLNIESQPVRGALRAFAEQTGLQVLFRSESVSLAGIRAPRVAGELSAREALDRLLANTGLKYEFVNEHTVRITSAHPLSAIQGGAKDIAEGAPSEPRATETPEEAQSPSRSSSEPRPQRVEEIVVTAEKRSERLQDVPVPVTAISADTLLDSNQLRFQDYYASVPSLSLVSSGNGNVTLTIRGVTTGAGTNPTVGVTIDDVPYGSTTALGGAFTIPDVDPSDLARIEVLRGPQGTLYGASSIGGLLKFVTVDPSTDSLTGRVQGDLNGVHNGDGLGYGFRGAINVPLGDQFAIRASGFARRDPGYVDDAALHEQGINRVDVEGGRLSALWRPSADWSLKLSALVQNATASGSSAVTLQSGLGDLQQVQLLSHVGGYHHDVRAYSATLSGEMGGVLFTSISGYSVNTNSNVSDVSSFDGFVSNLLFGVPGNALVMTNETDKVTQEFRLSSSIGHTLDWLVGAFYNHERSPTEEIDEAINPATGATAGVVFTDPFPTTYSEYAVFSDLTFHLTSRFDVQLGGRESQNRQFYEEQIAGPFDQLLGLPSPIIIPPVRTKDHAFTYLATPRFQVSPDLMVYARLASGYRPGGPNPTSTLYGLPNHYNPDKTLNYELGVKGDTNEHLFSFDGSVYYIDWKDIQLLLTDPNTGANYYTNGSRAKSEGAELSVTARPIQNLALSAWVAWNDAQLTADLPPLSSAIGVAGDRLPYSSRLSGNFALDEEFVLGNNMIGVVAGSVSYIGDRESDFAASRRQSRLVLAGYADANMRAGVRYEGWAANLFVNNVLDRRGALAVSRTAPAIFGVNYIQPRTVGLSLSKTF